MRLTILALAALATAAAGTDYRISGPYTHSNLSIYLVHTQERTVEKTYLTLDEAMERRLVVVYETSDVNTLLIANVSKEEVYVQSGDIVKGGKQDRVIKEDMILQSMSGKVPIQVFCVEHGRWTQRGGESSGQFGSSKQSISGNRMKMAVRSEGDQRAVCGQGGGGAAKVVEESGGSRAIGAVRNEFSVDTRVGEVAGKRQGV